MSYSSLLKATLVAAVSSLLVSGCGGGGSSSLTEDSADTTITSPNAVLGVVLTDAPSDDIDGLLATIEGIELVGDSHSFTVFEGSERIDLLELPDAYELFTVTSVTPGSYDRIRFRVADITIVAEDETDTLVETPVALPSGTIEVAPEGGILVGEGEVLFLEIDFDIDKALELMLEEGGELMLQPVIFVKVETELPEAKFTRVHGTVDEVLDMGLRICDTQLVFEVDDSRRSLGACADVALDDDTTFFGAEGTPISFGEVMEGDAVTVVGRLHRRVHGIPAIPYGHLPPPGECRLWFSSRSTGDQPPPERCENIVDIPENAVLLNDQGLPVDDIFGVDALVVEKGILGTFDRYRGEAAGTVVGDQFDFLVDGEQGVVTDAPLPMILYPETRIFSTDGIERTPDVVQAELEAAVDGVLVLSSTEQDVIRAAFMVVKLDEDDELRLSGTVLEVDPATESLLLATATGDRCVDAEDADVFQVMTVDDALVTEASSVDALLVNQPVEVFGEEGDDGCFEAETIIADGA